SPRLVECGIGRRWVMRCPGNQQGVHKAGPSAHSCGDGRYLEIALIVSPARICSVLLDRNVNGPAAASSCGRTRGISFLTSMTSPGSTGVVSFASRTTAWPFRVRVMLIKYLP